MNIKNTTKLGALLREYPQVELSIAAILPEYGSLEQPHLRETVLAITTVEHLAQKTNRDVSELIQSLNNVIGIPDMNGNESGILEFTADDPDWIKQPPRHRIDGVELLTRGEHPLNVIQELLEEMVPGGMILLSTNFHPQPMLDSMNSAGVKAYSRKDTRSENQYVTFIQK